MALPFCQKKSDFLDTMIPRDFTGTDDRNLLLNSPSPSYSTSTNSEVCTAANDIEVAFWYEEFEDRYKHAKLEEREFERIRALEVEDYLSVHRNSRRMQKIRTDYIGRKTGLLSIHNLEYRYLQQDFADRKKKLIKDHKKWIINIQNQARDNTKLSSRPGGGSQFSESNECNSPFLGVNQASITSSPPVL